MESSDAVAWLELIDLLAYLMHIACDVIALILGSFIWHELCSFPARLSNAAVARRVWARLTSLSGCILSRRLS